MGKGLNKILSFDSKFNNNPNLQKTDKRLRWKPDEHGQIRKIRADRSQVWIPDVEIVNRIHDFSPSDEKPSKLQIEIDGRVTYTRFFIFQISQINKNLGFFECERTFHQVSTLTRTTFKLQLLSLLLLTMLRLKSRYLKFIFTFKVVVRG